MSAHFSKCDKKGQNKRERRCCPPRLLHDMWYYFYSVILRHTIDKVTNQLFDILVVSQFFANIVVFCHFPALLMPPYQADIVVVHKDLNEEPAALVSVCLMPKHVIMILGESLTLEASAL